MSSPWQQQPPHPHIAGQPEHVPAGTNPSAPPGMPPPPNVMSPPGPMMGIYHPGMPPYGAPPPPGHHPGYAHQPSPGHYYPGMQYPQPPPYNPHMGPPQPMMPPAAAPPVPLGQVIPGELNVAELSKEDQIRHQVESSLGSARLTTIFVGNIADGVTDELLNTIFSFCGPVKKWKRVLEASGTPKTFGFLEYFLAESLIRFIRLLSDVPLLGKGITLKVDESTREYLKKYQDAIKAHEASHPDSPQLSLTLENDLKVLDELNALFKQRNLIPAMQFVEKKVQELTLGPSKEPEPVFEHPKERREEKTRPDSKKPKRSSLTGWETPGYREREKRWESRESQHAKTRQQQSDREKERSDREKAEKEKLTDWIRNFDDSSFFFLAMDHLSLREDREMERKLASLNAPSFYVDRGRWRDRRQRDLERQLEADARDEKRDQEAIAKGELKAPAPRSKKVRQPLIPISYSLDELISAGYDNEAAQAKLQEQKKEKIRALISKIPIDQSDLFAWDLDWDLIDLAKVNGWIKKNVETWEEVREKAILGEDLESWIKERKGAQEMMAQMDGLPGSDIFVMRLWRYLIYETEATGYGLQ